MKVIVIGSGPAGYSSALKLKSMGVDVKIVESGDFGGTCLNRGCIPAKAILEIARRYYEIKEIKDFFTPHPEINPIWEKIKEYKTKVVTNLRSSLERLFFLKKIEIIKGIAKILSPKEIEVSTDGKRQIHQFDKLIIATGTKPFYPKPFDSHKDILIDSDRVFDLERIPSKLAIIGAGVIGIEIACFFNAVGVEVSVVDIMSEILPSEDPEVVRFLRNSLEKRGVKFYLSSKINKIEINKDKKTLLLENGSHIDADTVMIAAGRTTELQELNLGLADIKYSKYIEVNNFMQTSNPDIYACGDVNGISMLAHSAIRQAEIAAQHIVRANSERFDKNIVPLCIYSWPEYASVGFNTKTAKENGIDIKVKKAYFQALGKAVATMHTEGFIQIIIDENETVIGSQILGGPATEIIHTLAVAVKNKLKLKELKSIIYAHPTMSEIIMEAINR